MDCWRKKVIKRHTAKEKEEVKDQGGKIKIRERPDKAGEIKDEPKAGEIIKEKVLEQITALEGVSRDLPPNPDQHRREARENPQTPEPLKVLMKMLPPTFPPVGTKTGLAVEGSAKLQIIYQFLTPRKPH